ncbi:MAG: hypothetical protein K6E91_00705 [Butyrivibrio sp.]|nr:hypothetical protein [Butyrivibrio sp.]
MKDERMQKLKSLLKKMSDFDVLGSLDKLFKAQKDGASPEEIEKCQKEAARKIINAKRACMKNNLQRAEIRAANKGRSEADVERKKQEMRDMQDSGKRWEKFRNDLKDDKKLDNIEKEISVYYSDPVFGNDIKAAFENYKKAVRSAQKPGDEALNGLIDELIKQLTIPVIKTFGYSGHAKEEKKIDYSAPKTFVDVMGEVVMDEWKKALKALKCFQMLKYGSNIKGDIERRDVGYREIAWELLKEKFFG